jgi:hypothetical protein
MPKLTRIKQGRSKTKRGGGWCNELWILIKIQKTLKKYLTKYTHWEKAPGLGQDEGANTIFGEVATQFDTDKKFDNLETSRRWLNDVSNKIRKGKWNFDKAELPFVIRYLHLFRDTPLKDGNSILRSGIDEKCEHKKFIIGFRVNKGGHTTLSYPIQKNSKRKRRC